eukprot:c26246_g1_i1 orf=480-2450(-)
MLPSTTRDALYDNAKLRRRSFLKVVTQALLTSSVRRDCGSCGIGKMLALLMLLGLLCLTIVHPSSPVRPSNSKVFQNLSVYGSDSEEKLISEGIKEGQSLRSVLRRPPRLPPRISTFRGKGANGSVGAGRKESSDDRVWKNKQVKVVEAFRHAWNGYKTFAMGYDELMPLSGKGVDGLGGLGATVVDALDTAIIMGLDDVVMEAGSWIEEQFPVRFREKGQVNLFETTIRILGGLLSAYHLMGGDNETHGQWGETVTVQASGLKPELYLERAKDLADRLMFAFTSSPTPIPFSDVVLSEKTAHPAGFDGGASSTSEVTTLQLEFLYLSKVSGDPKYGKAAMSVLEHFRQLPKLDGLVPIYVSPHTGQFQGNNIRLGSRGDSYYEYLLKVWLHQGGAFANDTDVSYLREMYDEAMEGVKHSLVQKSVPKGLVFVGELPTGDKGNLSPKMDHLVCFLAGNLALGATRGLTKQQALENGLLGEHDMENLQLAEDLARTCYEMYSVTATGLAPEIAYFNTGGAGSENLSGGKANAEYKDDIIIKRLDRHNLLRPETVESLFILYRITRDSKYRQWGWEIFQAFETHSKVNGGGYACIDDVTVLPAPKRDKMETFFLGETLKYLYLLFGDSNVLPLDRFVFNTEAHPFPITLQQTSLVAET